MVIRQIRDEERSTRNPEIKQFVGRTLLILEQHLRLAQAVEASLGGLNVGSSRPAHPAAGR